MLGIGKRNKKINITKMEIILIIVGLIVGALISWLFVKKDSIGVISKLETQLESIKKNLEIQQSENESINNDLLNEKKERNGVERNLTEAIVREEGIQRELDKLIENSNKTQEDLDKKTKEFNDLNKIYATAAASNESLEEKLASQKQDLEKLNEKLTTDFENIASKILDEKTEKFTSTNKANIDALLKPLGENLDKFKAQVEAVYDKESKERFSLGEKVKDLVGLNEKLSKDAQNLTTALKADPKKQGNWGEMILERILEQSGLTKDREYYLENYLKDDDGNYMLNDDGKKMRPDAIIQYPDERKVIIDAKVSINAYIRYVEAETDVEQKLFLKEHVDALKSHIVTLSNRGYENFEKSLDFVMMFVPNEPAFMMALKEDKDLWHFAYKKRILLISPTNLIATLKLIEDLWKREHQNQNAKAIADRGAKLYEKFVNFSKNFKTVGKNITAAQTAYDEAFKQLATGSDNLVLQTEKMKALGITTKAVLDPVFLDGNEVEMPKVEKVKELDIFDEDISMEEDADDNDEILK